MRTAHKVRAMFQSPTPPPTQDPADRRYILTLEYPDGTTQLHDLRRKQSATPEEFNRAVQDVRLTVGAQLLDIEEITLAGGDLAGEE
jgi:hypothetical protein